MISKLGLYWDDWFIDWYIHFLKPQFFKEVFIEDRPLLGWLYVLTTSLIGESPFGWQLFGIFTRWACTISLWWMLKGIWPRKVLEITAISLLFAVYPGFSQQYIAISYSHHLIVLTMTFVSLGALNWGLRYSQWFWPLLSLSVISSGLAMFTMEYFFGLEFLRPVVLWLILSETIPNLYKRIQHFILVWLPYIALMILFLVWRVPTETPRARITFVENLGANPIAALLELGRTILQDLFTVTALAWKQTLNLANITAYESVVILKYGLIVLGVAVISILYLAALHNMPTAENDGSFKTQRRWALQMILLGLYSLVIAGIPFWMTNLSISLSFPWDRFTIPMMLGASLLLVGLIEILPIKHWQTLTIIGIAAGLAAGMHFQNALSYRKAWLLQRDFFWQLTWRAPAILPNTVILTTEMSFPYNRDDSLSAPLNWIYSPESSSLRMDYIFYNVESRLSPGLSELDENLAIKGEYRLSYFDGSASQAIFLLYKPPSCVKVIDPLTDQYLPDKPRYFRILLPLSKPSLILPEGYPTAQPPPDIFGPEPTHEWCYYFEKAELARQLGDWQQVAMLGDKALGREIRFSRGNVAELAPFIEGYAHTEEYHKAVQLSLMAYKTRENTGNLLCDTWERINQATHLSPEGEEAFKTMIQTLNCAAH
jgi:hypothetical protein